VCAYVFVIARERERVREREKYARVKDVYKKKNRKLVESKRITEVLTIIIKINIIGRKSTHLRHNNNIIIILRFTVILYSSVSGGAR
jgi:hypothetical protein